MITVAFDLGTQKKVQLGRRSAIVRCFAKVVRTKMALSAAFVVVACGVDGHQSSEIKHNYARALCRRSVCKISASVVIGAVTNALAARAQIVEDGSHALRRFMRQSFAREMEYGMRAYERLMAEKKKKLFGAIADGSTVLDVGIGTGANIQYMPKHVKLIGVEPNKFMWRYAREKARLWRIELTLMEEGCENLRLGDESCDVVITTLTLCSVQRPERALEEMFRVLKRGGRLVFIEHVIAPRRRAVLRAVQTVVNPLQMALADGCHVNRDTLAYLKDVNGGVYEAIELEEFDALFGGVGDWVSVIKPHVAGFVVK